jgi:cellulose synthase/poly-beta-1,6-N-acetylglucosamine synthase-like glycosyltransferase
MLLGRVILLAFSFVITLLFFLYGYNSYYLLGARRRYKSPSCSEGDCASTVAIHLPVYNERYVVGRLISACAAMAERYGARKVRIVVIDDSDDDTRTEVDRISSEQNARGVRVEVLRRTERNGYKAGALQAALSQTPEDFVAVFDADFIPPADFLTVAVPHLAQDPGLGVVQSRWGHVNRDYNLLTRTFALGIDVHFLIEQPARCAAGCFLNFNGSGGIMRASAMREAGGWQSDTLAEDLDLSYRLQLKGYRILYLRELECPGEVPPTLPSWKKQQARWACGSLRAAKKLLPTLLSRGHLGLKKRLQGFIHLTYYMVHPLMLLSFLLACAAAFFDLGIARFGFAPSTGHGALYLAQELPWLLLVSAIALCTLAVWLCPLVAIRARGAAIFRNIPSVLLLGMIGFGVSLSNSVEALKALFSARSWPFKRTPKYAVVRTEDDWKGKRYQVSFDVLGLLEALLAAIGIAGAFMAGAHANVGLVPVLALYAASYALVSGLTLLHSRKGRAHG